MTMRSGPADEERAELVERVAREIHLRGLTMSAVHFLEASRPESGLSGGAMLFFDPVLRQVFASGDDPVVAILADDEGIDRLIDRLLELDEEEAWEV
ncbi:MAG: hypothetical protein MUE82_03105 [Chloroflexi bacterium]|jgi:hypothetical protein|nr:hypothetical protein [Chloroflexota bacterium]